MSTEVQDILNRYLKDFLDVYALTAHQYKVVNDIIKCRTEALGGHADKCDKCGYIEISYNSCRNRHCPKCQTYKKEKWIDARKEDLLPVPYFHTVFTIPEQLNMIMHQNQEEMYKILFAAVSRQRAGMVATWAMDELSPKQFNEAPASHPDAKFHAAERAGARFNPSLDRQPRAGDQRWTTCS